WRNGIFFKLIVLSIGMLLPVVGCTSSQAGHAVKKPRPRWCDSPPENKGGMLYFVALSGTYPTEAEARDNALARAPKLVLDFVGSKIESEYKELVKGRGTTQTGVTYQAQVDSFIRQITAGIVRNLKPIEWYLEETSTGNYQAYVLARISQESIDQSIREAKRKEEEARKRVLAEIESFIASAEKLAGRGEVVAALGSLKRAREKILGAGIEDTRITVSEVEIKERTLVSKLKLLPLTPVETAALAASRPVDLKIRVAYQSVDGEREVADFPLVFRHGRVEDFVSTDSRGTAGNRLTPPPEQAKTIVTAAPDVSSLAQSVSKSALRLLGEKKLTFRILVTIDTLIPKPLKADFNIRLWTDDSRNAFKVDEEFKIKYSCFTQRCYLKIFAYENEGPAFVVKDVNKMRLTLDQIKSFRMAGDTPGRITVFLIGSSEAFSITHKRNTTVARSEFRGMIRTLRESTGKKAEFKLVLDIE
ncbi:MAG: hypothetical protein GY866_17175, partial [Proteobacteria bacterium]|nr:hypothetical protein [Pseudomonadota bacterium]